jgi:hypothetical protein
MKHWMLLLHRYCGVSRLPARCFVVSPSFGARPKLVMKGTAMVLLSLFLSSCLSLMPNAKQPTDGPRARVRLAAFAGELAIEVTQPDGKSGTLYARSGFYPHEANLGMPKGSIGPQGRNEYFVVGNQVVLARSLIQRRAEGGSPIVSECQASGLIRLETGKDYEIGIISSPGANGWDIGICFIIANELISLPDGKVKMIPVRIMPAPPKKFGFSFK